jgi:kynurenine 3-monooxygenase
MLIALPNMDGSFTCTLFLAYDRLLGGENSFESLNSKEKVKGFFEKNFPDALSLMPALVEDFFENPTGSLITIKCTRGAMAARLQCLVIHVMRSCLFSGRG